MIDRRHDIRIMTPESGTRYIWSADLPPGGSLEVGKIELLPGGTLAGWLAPSEDTALNVGHLTLSLEPETAGWLGSPDSKRGHEFLSAQAETDVNGFFQIAGIPDGSYSLRLVSPEVTFARAPSFRFLGGENRLLDEALLVQPELRLEVYIDPPTDHRAEPWTLQYARTSTDALARDFAVAESTEDGYFAARGLSPGSYILMVSDSEGSRWHAENITLEAGTVPLLISLELVAIEGRVTGPDGSISAEIIFGSETGRHDIRMQSGEDGRYRGRLPYEGLWPVGLFLAAAKDGERLGLDDLIGPDEAKEPCPNCAARQRQPDLIFLKPVEVKVRPGLGRAVVDLDLPDTLLAGTVILAENELPVPEAVVVARRPVGEPPRLRDVARAVADRNGEFEIRGLYEGVLQIRAVSSDGFGEWERLEFDGDETLVELAIDPRKDVSGLVTSTAGGPIPGAQIVALPRRRRGRTATLSQATSHADGSFTLSVAQSAETATLLVVPPGLAARLLLVTLDTPVLDIVVGSRGGELVIDVEEGAGTLFSEGASWPLPAVAAILKVFGRAQESGQVIHLSGFQEGAYLHCRGPDLSGECVSGFLTAAGELRLEH